MESNVVSEYNPLVHDEKSRCYSLGAAVHTLRCNVDCALSAKDPSDLKLALYQLSQAGKKAALATPEGKDLANKISHRGRRLLKIVTDLGQKAVQHERFLSHQLGPLRGYAMELENRSMNSCLGFNYPSHNLEDLPPIPKDVVKAADNERKATEKRLVERHKAYIKKIKKRR